MTLFEQLVRDLAEGLVPEDQRSQPLWTPNPGPQALAIASEADELFYGGQAGGGKTDLLLGAGCTTQHKSIIFRRENEQLKDIISRSWEIYGSDPRNKYNANDRIWRFPGGRSVEFGGAQRVGDEQKYQGRAHDGKFFDELPHFTEQQYLFLSGWNRSTRRGQRSRIIGAGNPPTTPEGEWVLKRWGAWLAPAKHSNPAKPGELRWFVRVGDVDREVDGPNAHVLDPKTKLPLLPRSRTFIPAALSDNPKLVGTGYEAVLDSLPEPLRSQMRDGNFLAGRADDPWQAIPTGWVEAAMARWTSDGREARMDALGVDVARGGRDQVVIAPRHGAWIGTLVKRKGAEMDTGGKVAQLVVAMLRPGAVANLDVIGVGASAYDILAMAGAQVTPINFAESSAARDRSGRLGFANKRAEGYWRLREALDPDLGVNLALPPDDELKADLTAPRWKLTLRGIQIEAKEDIATRIGRSTDCGDAVVLATMEGEVAKVWEF